LQSNYQFKQQKKNKACFEAKAGPRKKSLAFLFEEINALKRQLKPSLKRLQAVRRAQRKAESIFYTEINFTTSSDEGEREEDLFSSSKPFRSSKTKLAKSSHPTTNH
jgi:hypothetical protein